MPNFIVVDNGIVNLSEVRRITADKKRLTIIFHLGFWGGNAFKRCTDSQHFEAVFKDIVAKLEAEQIWVRYLERPVLGSKPFIILVIYNRFVMDY